MFKKVLMTGICAALAASTFACAEDDDVEAAMMDACMKAQECIGNADAKNFCEKAVDEAKEMHKICRVEQTAAYKCNAGLSCSELQKEDSKACESEGSKAAACLAKEMLSGGLL